MSRDSARDDDEDTDGEEAQHKPWQPDWEQNAWNDSDKDQLVLPDDSASNVESNVESIASLPPLLMSSARVAGASRHSRVSSNKSNAFAQSHPHPPTSPPAAASGNFYSALGIIAEQRKAQHNQLQNEFKRMHERVGNMAYAHNPVSATRTPAEEKRRSTTQHRKEASFSASAWDRAPTSTNTPAAGTAWTQWATTAAVAPPPSEVDGSYAVHKSTTKETKKGKGRKKDSSHLASNVDDPWGAANGEGVWTQEANAWANGDGWDAPQPEASTSKTKKRPSAWDETEPWANPAPAMNTSTSWGAWDSEHAEVEPKEGKKSGGIGKFFGKIFSRKSKGKEKHVQIKDDKPKRSKSKTLKKKRDSDSDKTIWPDAETMEEAERQQEWDEVKEGEDNGWGTSEGWDTTKASNGWGKQSSGGWGKEANGGWAKEASGGWAKEASGGWGKDAGGSWGKDAAGGRGREVSDGWTKNPAEGWGTNASSGWPTGGTAWEKDPPRPAQSRTHSYATQGSSFAKTAVPRGYQCIDSGGEAIAPARAAFYSRQRLARERIFWAFDPGQDERVAMMLHWIEQMKSDIAIFGFQKFLKEKDRGALFTNVDYRPPSRPTEPAFDWLSFDHIQMTYDRTFGESLVCYEPATHILVFVFLLSESKRSMAVWRRKLEVPRAVLQEYSREFKATMAGLRPLNELQIPIDEELPSGATPSRSGSKKNKWLRWA